MTAGDDDIRATDLPERVQLARLEVHPEDMDLEACAAWIYDRVFSHHAPSSLAKVRACASCVTGREVLAALTQPLLTASTACAALALVVEAPCPGVSRSVGPQAPSDTRGAVCSPWWRRACWRWTACPRSASATRTCSTTFLWAARTAARALRPRASACCGGHGPTPGRRTPCAPGPPSPTGTPTLTARPPSAQPSSTCAPPPLRLAGTACCLLPRPCCSCLRLMAGVHTGIRSVHMPGRTLAGPVPWITCIPGISASTAPIAWLPRRRDA